MEKNSKNRKTGLLIASISALLSFILLIVLAYTTFDTKTYWVLNRSIDARTQITADMLSPRTISAGGIPPTALSKEQIERKPLYSKVPLMTGEPVTASNVGDLNPINTQIPKNFTVASISLAPVNANLGAIKAGDHINIYRITGDGAGRKAYLVMQNVKVLNAGSSVETANVKTSQDGKKQAPAVNTVYQLAVSPHNAANLAVLSEESSSLYVTPTPASGVINDTVVSDNLSDNVKEFIAPNADSANDSGNASKKPENNKTTEE